MKKFLIRFFCFLCILTLLLGLIGTCYDRLSPVSGEFQHSIDTMPETIDLAVIGSSHALYGMDLTPYSQNAFNFSMAGQTPRYDYQMLKQFEDRIADGATILMSVSYMSPFWTEPESQFQEKQTRYYRFLDKENILQYDSKEALRVHFSTAVPAARILFTDFSSVISAFENFSWDVLFPRQSTAAPGPQTNNTSFPEGEAPWCSSIQHQKDVLDINQLELIRPVYPQSNPQMLEAYENIFLLAQEHHWRIIAVTTPFSQVYNQMYDESFPDFQSVFHSHMDPLFEEYGIEYWDASHDPAFFENSHLFLDMDHLSQAGKQRFSEILAQRLDLI